MISMLLFSVTGLGVRQAKNSMPSSTGGSQFPGGELISLCIASVNFI